MASNYNREWDQGKGYGGYENYYDASASRTRPREEDYEEYAGGEKRRKYQNGDWRGQSSANEEEYGWSGSAAQYNEYHAGQESWRQDDGHARGSFQAQNQNQNQNQNRRRLVPSDPSPHVIFLGLDSDHTEADLHGYLLSMGCVLDNVTIIRDRATGLSKGFGFAQFSSTEHAKSFVSPRFPFISVPPPASHGASALQAYNLALESGGGQNGRRVKIDFSQSAHPPERGGARGRGHQANDGTRDIGNTQALVVLLRGLDFSCSPETIAQGLRVSAGPSKEGAKGMKRIMLIKDKYSNASWGFAFIEFIDVQSSSAFLADLMSPQLHPSGFRIAERPVAASFAHPYSFQPLAENMLRDESCVPSSLATGGVEDTWAKYWDEGATVAELAFEVETPVQIAPEKESKPKKKKDVAKVDEVIPVEASTLPVSDKPVTLSFKGGLSANKPNVMSFGSGPVKHTTTSVLGFTTDNPDAPNTEDDETLKGSAPESEKASAFKKVPPLIASKKVANNISKWNTVQEELNYKAPSVAAPSVPTLDASLSEPSRGSGVASSASATPPPPRAADDEFEFSDAKHLACLLCSRQFKTTDQLRRHNKESDLHKARSLTLRTRICLATALTYFLKNFKDANLRQIAAQKASVQKTTQQPKYRDRASERRVLHNQPDVPLPDSTTSTQRKQGDAPPLPPPPPPPPVHPGKDESNIGNKLLQKMGWAVGTGLGTDGEGRVDPIETAVYAQGVGLGASKGKEIGKYADGYSGYVHAARDSAKERYEGH